MLSSHLKCWAQVKLIVTANTNMHNIMTERILRAPILFYDSNPIGRITTRFSKDMMMIDVLIPNFSNVVVIGVMRIISVLITVIIINPWLVIVFAIGCFFTMRISQYCIMPMIEA